MTATMPRVRPAIASSGWPWEGAPDLPDTHYLDNRIYTDAAVFGREQQRIFQAQWKFVCHASELPAIGSYRTTQVGGTPLVVLRDEEGTLRAFVNICPHRGATLVRDSHGTLPGNRLRCFYHHWTFSSQGQCVTVPLPHAYANTPIQADRIQLREAELDQHLGLVFVRLRAPAHAAPSLREFLGPVLDTLTEPLADLEVFHFHAVDVKANWKSFVETNAEGYHELLHRLNRTTGLSQPEYLKRQWWLHPHGHHTFAPAQIAYDKLRLGSRDHDTLPGMTANQHIVADIFPDVMVNARSTVVRIDALIPLAPGLTRLECRGLAPRSDSAEQRRQRVRQHNEVWGPLGRNLPEDIWAIETQWQNLISGALPYSILAREDQQQATDDAPVRRFYEEWRRLTGLPSHQLVTPLPEVADDAR